ncbi:hypothetical protein PQO03_03430 [Lentisphaera profundi]|uniref:Uncharacterized protein n=1 Tax=Lentisphaera profundi TaxID=1658616 RepID=A0ABY7VTG2_9BACT|nr:hypothetical protein [Lentisphaera profundi]WDE97012.1 hypothetical protein PQO03_03430 [Lentisphaera profundi]
MRIRLSLLFISILLAFTSCQQNFNSDRSNVKTELDIESEGWKQALTNINTSRGQKYYYLEEGKLNRWEGVEDVQQLISIVKEKELIILDLWDRRNEEWQVEQLVYKAEQDIEDFIALKHEGVYQIAKVYIQLEPLASPQSTSEPSEPSEPQSTAKITAIKFISSSPGNKSFPAYNKDKQVLLYNVVEKSNNIEKLDLNSGLTKTLIKNGSGPRWVDENQFVFTDESQTQRELYLANLEGKKTKADENQVKLALEVADTYTGKAYYALKLSELKEYETASYSSLKDLLRVVSQRSPQIKVAKHEALTVLAEYFLERYNKGPDLVVGASYTGASNLATEEEEQSAGDYSSLNDFMRITTGLNFTVIPNRKFRESFSDYKHWRYEEAIQVFYQAANDEMFRTLSNLHKIIHKRSKIQILETIINTCDKSMKKYTKMENITLDARSKVDFFKDQKAFYERQLVLEDTELLAARDRIRLSLDMPDNQELNLALLSQIIPPVELRSLFDLLNHSDLNNAYQRQLYFQIMQAAAERDMGHPVYRRDYLNLQVNYGFGIHHWDKVMDDFVSVSANTMVPLRSEELQLSYNRQWTNRVKSLRYQHDLSQKNSKIKITELYRKIKGFKSYHTQFQHNLLNMYDKIRRQVALNKLGNYSKKEMDDLDEVHLEYLNGQLEERDVSAEGTQSHLDLLREVGDFHMYPKWFADSSRDEVRVFHAAKFSDLNNDLHIFKNKIKSLKDFERFYLILETKDMTENELEIQYVYKKTLEKKGGFIPTFYNDSSLESKMKKLIDLQDDSRAYFDKVGLVFKKESEIKAALDLCLEYLGENQELHLFLPQGIKSIYIPPEITQKINLYSTDYSKAKKNVLIHDFEIKKINVLYKERTNKTKTGTDELTN